MTYADCKRRWAAHPPLNGWRIWIHIINLTYKRTI